MTERMRRGRGLAIFALLVSIVALVIAVMAYQRTGARVKVLEEAWQKARQETADALGRVEDLVRGSRERQR